MGFSTAAYEKILEDSPVLALLPDLGGAGCAGPDHQLCADRTDGLSLSKTNAQFRGRNIYANLMIFAMLFNGGMIPTFLVVKSYGLLNTVWALVLPGSRAHLQCHPGDELLCCHSQRVRGSRLH